MTTRSSTRTLAAVQKSDPDVLEKITMPKENALATMASSVVEIFNDAQKPDTILRANAIKLREVQMNCCLQSPRIIGQPEDIDHEGEAAFLKLIFKLVNMVIKVRKKEPTADRVQRFIAGFLQYIQTKDEEAKTKAKEKKRKEQQQQQQQQQPSSTTTTADSDISDAMSEDDNSNTPIASADTSQQLNEQPAPETTAATNSQEGAVEEDDDDDEPEYETVTSRFVESLIRHLFKGFRDSKSHVRLRCCQMIALSISSMGELDEDLYQDLKTYLFEAHIDKEANVRAQAATALCRLQSDTEVDPADGRTIHEKLMWSVRFDPSPEVRRLILFNVDVTSNTLPHIVKSVRDPDDINRRVVYLKPLSDIQDFRLLSFDERHEVLKWGLNDRNKLVRKSALKMFSEKWIQHAGNNLIEFLERLEATHPHVSSLIEQLLKAFFEERLDIVNEITFDDEFWSNLSGESALLAKVVIEFLQNSEALEEKLDSILPEVTRHVFNLENYFNLYRASCNAAADAALNYEFITTQMLDISLCLDYADEVGRKKMFEVLRNILRSYELIDDHLERVIKIFRMISIDEKDFTRSIIEIISDIQEDASAPFYDAEDTVPNKRAKISDSQVGERSEASSRNSSPASSLVGTEGDENEEATIDSLVTQFRCLNICKRMLENSYEPLTENSNLYGLLNDLIVPAVQNSDTLLRQEGLHCLGLCCTLDKRLAQHNFSLFITCIKQGHDDLVKKAVRTLGDLLLMYGVESMSEHLPSTEEIKEIFEFALDNDNPEVQSLATQSLCKLMLFNRFNHDELLRLLILLYFFPKAETDEHSNTIHQCLAYFFPAYCYSSKEHQKSLSNITIPALEELCNTYDDLAKDETMTSPKVISEMLADWNDPRKLAKLNTQKYPSFIDEDDIEENAYFSTPAEPALKALEIILNEQESPKRKTMCHFVLRLYLEKVEVTKLIDIQNLIKAIEERNPIKLVPTQRAFSKLSKRLDEIIDENEEGQSLGARREERNEEQQQEEEDVQRQEDEEDQHTNGQANDKNEDEPEDTP